MPDSSFRHWRIENDPDGIAWLTIDKKGANANVLSSEVLEELEHVISIFRGDAPKGIVIHSGKSSGFIAGADISEFTEIKDKAEAYDLVRRGQTVFDALDALTCPTVCLIDGFCLGGGFELALACDYRIAIDQPKTRIGLPEVRLGIHPGFGGSIRLTRLVGGTKALELMLTGRAVSARAAARVGMIDYAVTNSSAQNAARGMIRTCPPHHRPDLVGRISNHWLVRPALARWMRRTVAKRAPKDHYPAPYALIELWKDCFDDANEMFLREAESVSNLITGDTARNLVRVFFLQERLKSLGKGSNWKPTRVHVVGAGTMGGDIAAWCALKGFQVTLQDRKPEFIAPAIGRAAKLFKTKLRKPALAQAAVDRLSPDPDGYGIERADVVIEAIIEDRDAKAALFEELESRVGPETVLATNTSSIPLSDIASGMREPTRLVGLHFFNPVAKMQLVEVIRDEDTRDDVQEQARIFTSQISRLPLPTSSSPGFLVNRILMPYLMEAIILESEGVQIEWIDWCAKSFGMPMGPLELADTVGLDICLHVGRILAEAYESDVPPRLEQLVDAGRLGKKSGSGFYEYRKGKPVRSRLDRGPMQEADVVDRLILPLLNEAVACLDEKVVDDADLLDAGIIFGTGFAPFSGGPIQHIRDHGVHDIADKLSALSEQVGTRYTPHPGWENLKDDE